MNITIIGAGAFGKALKHVIKKAEIIDIEPDGSYSDKTQHLIHTADVLLISIPSQALKNCLKMIKPLIRQNVKIISCIKALYYKTDLTTPTQIIKRELGIEAAALSGPNISKEILNDVPTFAVLAGPKWIWDLNIQSKTFQIIQDTDTIGTEFAGATKNILALASGIIHGKYGRYSSNMQGATVSLMIEELNLIYRRYSREKTGKPKEIPSIPFISDVITTCTSELSRNRACGKQIGRGKEIPKGTIEGCDTLKAVREYSKEKHIDTPLIEELFKILYRGKRPTNLLEFAR